MKYTMITTSNLTVKGDIQPYLLSPNLKQVVKRYFADPEWRVQLGVNMEMALATAAITLDDQELATLKAYLNTTEDPDEDAPLPWIG